MKSESLIISEKEHELLRRHCNDAILSDHNRKKLLIELANARIVDKEKFPKDVVCVNSEITFKETKTGQYFSFKIVWPLEADISQHKMSALAPLSIALLGYRKGALVDWEMPTGIKTFEILNVQQLHTMEIHS